MTLSRTGAVPLAHLVRGAVMAITLALPCRAGAQQPPLPSGTQKADAATKGTTDVTKDQYQGMDRKTAEESKDATDLSVSAGGLQSSGNSRLLAATLAEKFRLRRDSNQFREALAANYGRTAAPGGPWETTVQNVQGMLR